MQSWIHVVGKVALAGRIADGVILNLVPQRVADGFVARGSAAQVAARLAEYRAAGVDLPVIFPVPVGSDWGYERTIGALTV